MCKAIKYTCPSGYTCLDYLRPFFLSLDCPLISVSDYVVESGYYGFHVYIDIDKIDLYFFIYENHSTETNQQNVKATVRGTVVYNGNYSYGNYGVPIFTILYDDNMFYMQINGSRGRDETNRFYDVCLYEKLNNNSYTGYIFTSEAGTFRDISNIPLTDDNALSYLHGKLLKYTAQLGFIDYSTDHRLFVSDTITDIVDNRFVDCSTMTIDQVITIDGKNYYSIGTNTLVPLDEE